MIKIKLSELKEFFRRAKSIKDNGMLPILAYLKLECDGNVARITKNALSSFIIYEIEDVEFEKNITLLLEQKTMNGFLSMAKGDTVEIELKGKEVVITDGNYKVRHAYSDEKLFPIIQEVDRKAGKHIGQDMLEAMNIARGYVAHHPIKIWLDYVYIKPLNSKQCCVFGSEGNVMYFKKFDAEFPEIALDPEVCSILAGMGNVVYSKNGNYNFFDSGKSIYGFSDVEQRSPTFEMLADTVPGIISFQVDKETLSDFCEGVLIINPSLVANCYLREAGKKQILLQYVNEDYNLGAEVFAPIEKKGPAIEEFWFNPKLFLQFLKGLPYEKLTFRQFNGHTFYVTDEEDKQYIGLMRGLVPNPEAVKAREAAISNGHANEEMEPVEADKKPSTKKKK